jgi:cardiolipin synthase
MMSYIFESVSIGREMIDALGRACQRGADVRLLIDDAGSPDAEVDRLCELRGVALQRFLPVRLGRRLDHFNLRNHRKLLIIDGRVGFTGGLNVHHGHVLSDKPAWPVRDTHFRLEGPVVEQLTEVFIDDWCFTTGEAEERVVPIEPLSGDTRQPGAVHARALAEGPDENFDRVRLTLLGALACAKRSVGIVSPYFLPDQALVTAIRVAGLRGICVDVVLPARSDIRLVDYASWAQLWQVLGENIRVWLSPAPFDHSKLMVVDEHWSFVGSANWDPRSLRLNFELNVECYGAELARQVRNIVDARIAESRRITPEVLAAVPLALRIRNGICRLFMPYI